MQKAQQKILLTGATGFIGLHLCEELYKQGQDVRAFVRKSSNTEQLSNVANNLHFLTGDLSDEDSLKEACENVDIVIHLAGIAHVNNVSQQQLRDINSIGAVRLFRVAVEAGVKRIIFLSSALAQAAEDDNATAYGRAKYEAELALRGLCAASATCYTILRPVNVYGLGMKGNIAKMIGWIKRGILPALPAVDTRFSLISVEDLARLIVLSINHPKAADKCFVVAEKEPYKLLEIEAEIYRNLQKKRPTRRSPRVLLYVAAATAGLLGRILAMFKVRTAISGINLRTYNNLVGDSVSNDDQVYSELEFEPQENFFKQLPLIVNRNL